MSVAAIIGPLLMTQALAAGSERGFPGAAFLTAAVLVACAMAVVVFGVLKRPVESAEPVGEA
jgi:DHA1 family tetracycline resistance protein-like MFS transporter